VLGLSGVPDSGDEVLVVESERKAREVADFRKARDREVELQKQQASKMDNFLQRMEEGDISTVNVLLKSDVRGSAQALVEALEELSTDEVKVKVVSSGVGGINNTDINLAATSDALVLGFNVRADATTLSRNTRIGESFLTTPSSTIQPAISPNFCDLNTSFTLAIPIIFSLSSGLSSPLIMALTSSIRL
jgi:translation initiation factor IF-2